MMSNEDPIYVSATVKFNNHTCGTWNQIQGTEYMTGAMMSMSHKYPFRLNFDKFEDDYPEIDNKDFTALTNSYSTTTGMTLHS